MQLEEFEKRGKDEWMSKEPVSTVMGDVFVGLIIHDRAGPPDEAMLKLASELAAFARANGEMIVDSIYAHYRNSAEIGNRLDFWEVPKGLRRDEILSQVESVDLSVSRDRDSERVYDTSVNVSPNWDLEHGLFLRYADGKLTEFDPMGGE